MSRVLGFLYGVISYAVFFVCFLYLAGFLGNLFVPKSIDSGVAGSLGTAALINSGLILLFGLQHSVTARPGFKAWLTRVLPQPLERSTYVLATSVVLILTYAFWQPMPQMIWQFESELGRSLMIGLLGLGFLLVLYVTFLIDHFDLFGLRQVYLYLRGRDYTDKSFVTPSLYKVVRHPLYIGWFMAFWMTPDMTAGHLLMAAGQSLYILIAIVFEERDLEAHFGATYQNYKASTPMLIPRLR